MLIFSSFLQDTHFVYRCMIFQFFMQESFRRFFISKHAMFVDTPILVFFSVRTPISIFQ